MVISRNIISWIIIAVLILIGLAVGRSIWSSLQDARAKLDAQKEEMAQVIKDNETLTAVRDSLHRENDQLNVREKKLLAEKNTLNAELRQLRIQNQQNLARIDTLWEAKSIMNHLDNAFPEWAGLFWQASTPNGLEGMIAPRFFSNHVLEIMEDLKGHQAELANCNRRVANGDSLLIVKSQRIQNLETEMVALDTTYQTLLGKYQVLNDKYNNEVKSGWFKFSPGNMLSLGVGVGVGYLVGKL